MSQDLPKFLKQKDDAILFNGDGEFLFYVPESYFSSKNAIIVGTYVHLLGILNYTIVDKSGKTGELKPFSFPSFFLTKPSKIESVKNIQLLKVLEPADYKVLHYSKDDIIIVSTKVPEDIENVEKFYKIWAINGNIPNNIPYNELHEYFTEAIQLNGASYGVTSQLIGILISELCRSTKDESIAFRHSGSNNMTDYKSVSIKMAPKIVSPYSSITSENWDEAVVNAIINKNKYKHTSPMEKILMT